MAKKVVILTMGWKIDGTLHTDVELRSPTVVDLLDAGAAAERSVQTPSGQTVLVQSPTIAGWEILRRQIVRIGSYDGPITYNMLAGLQVIDFEALQIAAAQMERVELEANDARGRDSRQPAAG